MTTAKRLAQFRFESVKAHVLHIMRGSGLEDLWHSGQLRLLELEEMPNWLVTFSSGFPHTWRSSASPEMHHQQC